MTAAAIVLVLVSGLAPCAQGDAQPLARHASDSVIPFLAAAEASLFLGGHDGRDAALQGLKALAVTDAATTVVKYAVREKRPHGKTYTSFPSRHASAAFCMATVASEYDNSWSVPAYGAAVLIGWSRTETRSHYWWDVVAGAALGHFVAKGFTKGSSFSGETMSCRIGF